MILLALAMSMDAFAAAIVKGAALRTPRWLEAIRTGALFGVIETITPLMGWALGTAAARLVQARDHWIAFGLLGVLGLRMIRSALAQDPGDSAAKELHEKTAGPSPGFSFWALALTAFATSIDAMAVGAGLAFLEVDILPIAVAIGLATTLMVTLGVMLGRLLDSVAGKWAEVAGGIVLIGIGTLILIEHLRRPQGWA